MSSESQTHPSQAGTQKPSGKLTIFLGYAPGVGKTYAMLEAARQRRQEGVDVVIISLDTHGDAKTEALLAGMEVFPRLHAGYRGTALGELDVDAALARRPHLVVVDELAYPNPAGGRHAKRYQDVEELLAAGVDVYATLNIGQLESLCDVAAQITGVLMDETVPDRLLDQAYEIQVVDLLPAELLRRLYEGKVHVVSLGERAMSQFFRQGNLIALREITLRRTADQLDDQMRAYMTTQAISGPWPARERLLVCISPSPFGERLVRAARRMADSLGAAWSAIYVETPGRLSSEAQDTVARTLALAEELGAKAFVVPGPSVADAVLTYARTHNVTKIIAGKPLRPRWRELLRPSIVDQLIRQGAFDVHVVSGGAEQIQPVAPLTRQKPVAWTRYGLSIALVVGATLLSVALQSTLHITNLLMIFLFAEIISALAWGRGPAIVASALGALAFDFFLVPPRFTLAVDDTEYLLTFLGLFVVGVLISSLTERFKLQAAAAERRASETAILNELSRDLAAAGSLDAIMDAIIGNIAETFGREVAVLLPNMTASERLAVWGHTRGYLLDAREQEVAQWAYEHGQAAGRGTATLASAEARYLPLKTARGAVGVLGVKPSDPAIHLTPDQRRLLEAFASLAALAVERAQLAEEAERARVQVETERMRNSLLSSVSHDLRTPLAGITGAASSLLAQGSPLDAVTRQELTQSIYDEANRLNVLVRNLLDMTRLESGGITVNKAWQPLEEVVGAALTHMELALAGRPVTVSLDPDLPLAPLDEVSIEQVLVNLLENAIKYSPPDSPIDLAAWVDGDAVVVEVADRGSGLAPGDEERVFEKFYRAETSAGGVGLGLAICRGIVEVHGGRIWAENRPEGGASFRFTLPITGQPPDVPEEDAEDR
ncbi:MAG TPA: sensor histidine kinase KdpD [Anaerolineae bacterium]|nr:sensor histidine kinase KdpD [Anaerolineae bacterium]